VACVRTTEDVVAFLRDQDEGTRITNLHVSARTTDYSPNLGVAGWPPAGLSFTQGTCTQQLDLLEEQTCNVIVLIVPTPVQLNDLDPAFAVDAIDQRIESCSMLQRKLIAALLQKVAEEQ